MLTTEYFRMLGVQLPIHFVLRYTAKETIFTEVRVLFKRNAAFVSEFTLLMFFCDILLPALSNRLSASGVEQQALD